MMTIWKYPLEITDEQTIELPQRSEILSVQMQNGVPTIWALVDPKAPGPKVKQKIGIFGTGNPIDGVLFKQAFIGTVQQGSLVWHVFTL